MGAKEFTLLRLSELTVILTFWSAGKLIFFTSDVTSTGQTIFLISKSSTDDLHTNLIQPLLKNLGLLALFIAQHSLMASSVFKNIFEKFNIPVLTRSVYIMFTAFCLMLLVNLWQTIYVYPLWVINATGDPLYWVFTLVHVLMWLVVYGGAVLMDLSELLGIKDVYYGVTQRANPLSYKSKSLQRLYSHMRHPSFTGFVVIFWFWPVMTIDRILIASLMSLYMYVVWKTDGADYEYQRKQFILKKYELQ